MGLKFEPNHLLCKKSYDGAHKPLFQPLKNHSLSSECSDKPSGKWEYGFHISCEAYLYYFPYNKTVPTKCVSQPDEKKVKAAIKDIFGLTVPKVRDRIKISQNFSLIRFRFLQAFNKS